MQGERNKRRGKRRKKNSTAMRMLDNVIERKSDAETTVAATGL